MSKDDINTNPEHPCSELLLGLLPQFYAGDNYHLSPNPFSITEVHSDHA
jgi:hypothetical protein